MNRAVNNRRRQYSNYHNYSNARYNYTTEAYSYAPAYDEYPEYNEGTRQRRRKAKRKAKVVYQKAEREMPMHWFKMVLTACVVFGFAIAILSAHAANTIQRDNILALTSELKEITENNVYLQTELTKNLDLNEVEQLASVKLGMQKPAAYQTVYINVPKEGYTVQYNDNADSNKKFDWKSLGNFMFRD